MEITLSESLRHGSSSRPTRKVTVLDFQKQNQPLPRRFTLGSTNTGASVPHSVPCQPGSVTMMSEVLPTPVVQSTTQAHYSQGHARLLRGRGIPHLDTTPSFHHSPTGGPESISSPAPRLSGGQGGVHRRPKTHRITLGRASKREGANDRWLLSMRFRPRSTAGVDAVRSLQRLSSYGIPLREGGVALEIHSCKRYIHIS